MRKSRFLISSCKKDMLISGQKTLTKTTDSSVDNLLYIYSLCMAAILCYIFYSAAITTIGVLYEKLGRMVGRSYEETVSLLMKSLKNSEVLLNILFLMLLLAETRYNLE